MQGWSLLLFVLAIIAGVMGFALVTAMAGTMKVLFFVFSGLFLLGMLEALANRRVL